MYYRHYQYSIENDTPTMRDLYRYVVNKHAKQWKKLGLELHLDWNILNTIEGSDSEQNIQKTLDKWLKLTPKATWKTLEVALTNVRRQELGLDPVEDVYSKLNRFCTYVIVIPWP